MITLGWLYKICTSVAECEALWDLIDVRYCIDNCIELLGVPEFRTAED